MWDSFFNFNIVPQLHMTIQFAQLYTRKIVLGTVVRHRFSQHITMNFKEMYTIRNRVHKQLIKHHSILMHIPIPNIRSSFRDFQELLGKPLPWYLILLLINYCFWKKKIFNSSTQYGVPHCQDKLWYHVMPWLPSATHELASFMKATTRSWSSSNFKFFSCFLVINIVHNTRFLALRTT